MKIACPIERHGFSDVQADRGKRATRLRTSAPFVISPDLLPPLGGCGGAFRAREVRFVPENGFRSCASVNFT